MSKFGTLTEKLSADSIWCQLYTVVVIIKWFFTVVVLLTLTGLPGIQIAVLFYLSTFFQAYICYFKPFASKQENIVQLFNEMTVTFYLLPCVVLTDYISDHSLKEKAAWVMIGITFAAAGLNFLYILGLMIMSVHRKYCLWSIKRKKAKLYIMSKTRIVLEDDFFIGKKDIEGFN